MDLVNLKDVGDLESLVKEGANPVGCTEILAWITQCILVHYFTIIKISIFCIE